MRIIAGKYRGRRLKTPHGDSIRPTTDRVRESMFNALNSRADFEDALVLDLFAGTGALGCEALSRGARKVIFVDRSRPAFKLIMENIKLVEHPGEHIEATPVLKAIRSLSEGPFDIVFMDPPYHEHVTSKVMSALVEHGKLSPYSVLVSESHTKETITPPPELECIYDRKYGITRLSFWQLKEDENA